MTKIILALIMAVTGMLSGSSWVFAAFEGVLGCQISIGQGAIDRNFAHCLRGSLELTAFNQQPVAVNGIFTQGSLYAALHASEQVAIHTEIRGRVFRSDSEQNEVFLERRTESLFVSVGNLSHSKWRLLGGNFKLLFGLDHSNVSEVNDLLYRSTVFFRTKSPAVSVTIWDGFGTMLDLSVSQTRLAIGRTKDTPESPESPDTNAFSIRLSHDISPGGGSKLLASIYDDELGTRKYGLAFLNKQEGNGDGSLEWIRVLSKMHHGQYPFDQLIRFNYTGEFKQNMRWLFEYEDELEKHYLTTVGFDHMVHMPLVGRFSVSYLRDRFRSSKNHWLYSLGLKCDL